MKKLLLALALAAVMVLSVAGMASAGEITGTGDATPIGDFWTGGGAASICSFSGLNDWPWDPENPGIDDPEGFGRTQNWGQLPKQLRDDIRAGNSPAPGHLEAPNVSCNPAHADH
jgi:hypothetical protein